MKYAENYERCCKEKPSALQRRFMDLLTRKARAIGQKDHRIWSLKYVLDRFFPDAADLRVLDCGAWNGWFLSYNVPQIAQRIALDFDAHFAPAMREDGIDFILADLERGGIPVAGATLDLAIMTSTLEHLGCPEHMGTELHRVLKPGGVVFITVPDIAKHKFRFWDDATHKRPYSARALRHLFESHGFETLRLQPYNHNFFIAGNLFPPALHDWLARRWADALLYVGRKAGR